MAFLIPLALLFWQAAGPPPAAEKLESAPAQAAAAAQTEGRTELNLLGRADTEGGESRRNENRQFNLIDNNALKELLGRVGATATIVAEFRSDHRYYGSEFGPPPAAPLRADRAAGDSLRGRFHYAHNNSALNARSFFQVGEVKPARENDYGFQAGAKLWRDAFLAFDGARNGIRGSVNGNVLVPMPEERVALAPDPVLRRLVQGWLDSYPRQLPNRTDINPRMLNTNSRQQVDDDIGGVRLSQRAGTADRIHLSYRFTLQKVTAFQLVAGQNPDTTTRAHEARATWERSWSPTAVTRLTAGFGRVGSLLVPEKNSPETYVSVAGVVSGLGPSFDIPINRAENAWRAGAHWNRAPGPWQLHAGAEFSRQQLNGYESNDHLGLLMFTNEFGRDALTNFRLGVPSWLYGAVGDIHRGFRRWQAVLFAGGQWRAARRLTLDMGLRHEAITRPVEVNARDRLPYASDWNNLAPRFGFGVELPRGLGVLRGAYGMHYGQIFPVTYSQIRYNPPGNTMFQFRLPDMRLPVRDLMRQGAASPVPPRLTVLSPDLVTPYSHQYNFSWEAAPSGRVNLQIGYVGSRSHQLLAMWFLNRAVVAPGVPQTFETVQRRRLNPNQGEHRAILNGSRSYFDALRATANFRPAAGVTAEVSYWFSKALALGSDHMNTGAGSDGYGAWAPSQFDVHAAMKGATSFHQPHAFLWRSIYDTPRRLGRASLAVVVLAKSGAPFSVYSGSDAPGFGNVDGSSGDRPHVVDPAVLGRPVAHPDTSRSLLPRSAFAFQAPTELRGNLGWQTFRRCGIRNVNASISRTFKVRGERRMALRMESINLFNTPHFAPPGSSLSNPDFGYITNTVNDGRAYRMVLDFDF